MKDKKRSRQSINVRSTSNRELETYEDMKSRIELCLKEKMKGSTPGMLSLNLKKKSDADKPLFSPTLIEDIADWGVWMRDRGASAGTDDWHVEYLRWALLNRCKEFMTYCKESDHPRAAEAIQTVQRVYDFEWPHNSSSGYIFHTLWGWLQLELEKPGECKPLIAQEQVDVIKSSMKKKKIKISSWTLDSCGRVTAVFGKKKAKVAKKKGRCRQDIEESLTIVAEELVEKFSNGEAEFSDTALKMGTWVHKDNVPDKYSMSRWKWLLKDSVTNERWATIQSWDDFLDWDDLTDEEYDLFSDLFMKTVLVEEIDAADFVPGYGIFKIKDNKRHTGYALILVTGYAFSGIEYNLDGIFCSIKAVQDYMSKGGMWN